MQASPAELRAWLRTHEGRKFFRYSMVSVVSVIVYEALLFFTLGLLHWSARWANVFSVSVSAIPSYYLNRKWAWGKGGRSHLLKEVVPFWVMALIGLVFSTWLADFSKSVADDVTGAHLIRTVIVMFGGLAAFGILWIAKYVILNKVLFVHHPQDLPEALDGRSGVPT